MTTNPAFDAIAELHYNATTDTLTKVEEKTVFDSGIVRVEELDEAIAEADRIYQNNERLLEDKNHAVKVYRDMFTKFESFQTDVRDVIIALVEEGKLSADDAEEILDGQLGLPGLNQRYRVAVSIEQVVYVTVEARDEDDARDKACDLDTSDILYDADMWSWEWETTGDVELER